MSAINRALLAALFLSLTCPTTFAEPAHALPEGFVYVHEVIFDVVLDIRYAGTHNFTGAIVDGYEAPYAILTSEAADALAKAADEFRERGYAIKVFDAYRPQRAVKRFIRWAQDADDLLTKDEFYPDFRNKTLLVDQGYIARNSSHTRGSAVDITLVDKDGVEIDMGTCFDFFGKRSWYDCKDLTDAQRENRRLLRDIMVDCGFRPFEKEWWHFRLINEPYDQSFDFPVR